MKKRLFWVLGIYILISIFFISVTPRDISWKDYFVSNSKQPYGLFVFKDLADNIFTELETKGTAIYRLGHESSNPENYIFISDHIRFAEDERNSLLAWVAEGNNAFISAKTFTEQLLDTLKIDDTYIYAGFGNLNSNIKVRSFLSETLYTYDKQYEIRGFTNLYDSLDVVNPIAVNVSDKSGSNNVAVVAQVSIGEGSIFLSSLPYAFTNYYMLHENNYEFAQDILSFLPNNKTYYDTYYKPKSIAQAPLKVFLRTKAFLWASILGLTLLLMHMIFNIKRKQKFIPIINPPENRSLEFTKTMGDLYHNTYDLKDLITKMERHFREHVKQKYMISDYTGTEEQTQRLLLKSGKKIGLISSLNTIFNRFRTTQTTDVKTIFILNKKLQQFYNES